MSNKTLAQRLREHTTHDEPCLLCLAANRLDRISFQSSCTGLWYSDPDAAGTVNAIKLDGEIFTFGEE